MKKTERIANSITELVGHTPLVRLSRMEKDLKAEVLVKLESFNPLSSVKDRIAWSMITRAEEEGILKPGDTIVEPTSGNTGIGLAFIAAAKGYSLIITMPDTMSVERRNLLKALGAQLILTPGSLGMKGSINKAEELAAGKGFVMLGQFTNPNNPRIHRETTAMEIWEDCGEKIDIFVAGVGTGGTITGVGSRLKELNPDLQVVAVEPLRSAVISGKGPGPHQIQGIGAGFIPAVFDTSVVDRVVMVEDGDAFEAARKLARTEGILCGISSGAALVAALNIAKEPESAHKRVVVILPDSGERYLSTVLFETP
ncbi:cysteine synthase A [Myxococcota bacterium]|nr:cysteine synthase A [Myxococcota bacterium]MBU1536734.1 cysteine synthase A [Myxococcota bacterium]